jgi:cellulose synthase/poly-beta-1,6-N-acetylglucosamine synthase-like glycosyltransferase
MKEVAQAFGLVTLLYFAALNGLYLAFTLYASRAIVRRLYRYDRSAEDDTFASPLSPAISVVLPAFNEAAGIVESINSLTRLRYPAFEIVVVNDGSTDDTMSRLDEAFDLVPVRRALRGEIGHGDVLKTYVALRNPRVIVVDKVNGGKADAINAGVEASRYEYVCAIDADAMLEEDALLRVAQPALDDPELVVATGGIVRIVNGCTVEQGRVLEVGLPSSRVAAFQVVEYFRAFLVGRVAWSRLRSLLIISGAFGLFRRDIVEGVGGWWTQTVGEDAELVVRLHHHMRHHHAGYRVEFVPDPVCWTEAPETLRVLARQRRRWQRGLAETLWRHRRMIGNPRYGAVGIFAMPYFLVFELLGPVIEVLGYLGLPVFVILGLLSAEFLIAFFVLAIGLGIFLSLAALTLEEFSFRRHRRNREIARMIWLSIAENFGYRQLTSLLRLAGLFDALFRPRSWGTMTRAGLGTRPAD